MRWYPAGLRRTREEAIAVMRRPAMPNPLWAQPIRALYFAVIAVIANPGLSTLAAPPQNAREQAQAIVSEMTLDEKIQQLHGAAPLNTPIAKPGEGPIEALLVMPRRADAVARLAIPAFV